MNTQTAGLGARLVISGSFECLDKDGKVLKVIEGRGEFPLEQLGMSVEEAQQLVKEQGNGLDDRK